MRNVWKLQRPALTPWPGVINRKRVRAASRHQLHTRYTRPWSLTLDWTALSQCMDSSGRLTACAVECTNANTGRYHVIDTAHHYLLDPKMSLFAPCSPDGACLPPSALSGISEKGQKFRVDLLVEFWPPIRFPLLQNVHFDVRNLNLIVVEAS